MSSSLPSPTHPSFIVTASSDSVPGQLDRDARDLYRVMGMIADDLADEIGISSYYVGGYSLGGTHAAFVSELDAREKRFNFKKAVVINPAVGALQFGQPARQHGPPKSGRRTVMRVAEFTEHLFDQVGILYNSVDQVNFGDPAFLFQAYATLEPPERELELLIGLTFRLTSNDMAFTSDVMTNAGYVVPKNAQLTATTSLTDVLIDGFGPEFRRLLRWRLRAVHASA